MNIDYGLPMKNHEYKPYKPGIYNNVIFYGNVGLFISGSINNMNNLNNNISYITISINCNSEEFSECSIKRGLCSSTSNGMKVFSASGTIPDHEGFNTKYIGYTTIGTQSNENDFGEVSYKRTGLVSVSNDYRCVYTCGDIEAPIPATYIEYINCSILSNSNEFGNLLNQIRGFGIYCNNGTTGIFGGGYVNGNYSSHMEYITISKESYSLNFGELTTARNGSASCCNNDISVVIGSYVNNTNVLNMEYVNLSTLSNGVFFGNMIYTSIFYRGTSNGTRGIYSDSKGRISYITLPTLCNSNDFGENNINGFACGISSGT